MDNSAVYENVYYKKVQNAEKEPPKDLIKQTQENVDDLLVILHNNVDAVIERDVKLTDLKDRSKRLENTAAEFTGTTREIKNNEWWKRMKTKLVFAGLILILLLVLILFIIETFVVK